MGEGAWATGGERVHAGAPAVLQVRGLRTHFPTPRGIARVLDGVDLDVPAGRLLGLVGESGSGKSVTAYSILRLLQPPARIVAGKVLFRGTDLLQLSAPEMEAVRGRGIAMIFQQPRASLNPVLPVGTVLAEVLAVHRGLRGQAARAEAVAVLARVGLPDPRGVLRRYPHQLSGGMCQRVMIALALSCQPELVIADEPTTGLDVTIQRQIIDLLARLRREMGLSQVLITHDLALVAGTCDEVAVMYAGQIAETGPADRVIEAPAHPYTRALLAARPRSGSGQRPQPIPGRVPGLVNPPGGCRFHPRCPLAKPVCAQVAPPAEEAAPGHVVRCHFWRSAS